MLQNIRLRSFVVGASMSLLLFIGVGFFTQAQAMSCTRLGSGAWSDPLFWGGDCNSISDVPGNGDTVTVGSGAVFLDGDVSISNLSVGVGAEVDALGNAFTVTSTAIVGGAVTSTTGSLTFSSEGGAPAPQLSIGSSGFVSSTEGLISTSSTDVAVGGVLANNAGAIYVAGYLTNAGAVYIAGASTLTLEGALTNSGSIPAQGTVILAGGDTVSISPGGASFAALQVGKTGGTAVFTNKLNVLGSLSVVSGALDVSAAGGADIGGANTVSLGATFTVGAGTSTSWSVLNNGLITVTTGGSVTSTSNFDISASGSLSLGALPSSQGVLDVGGSFTNGGSVNAAGGRMYVGGNFSTPGGFTAGVGTLFLTGTGDQTLGGSAFYNVVVDKSAGTVTKSVSATVGGYFTTNGTTSVELNGFDLIVSGVATIGSGTAVTSTSGALVFLGAATNSGSVSSTSGLIMFDGIFTNSAASYVQVSTGAIALHGSVIVNNGSIYVGAGTG